MKYYTLSNIIGDPFWLATVPMALVGWAVALVGAIINNSNDSSRFPVFSWWGIAFEMVAIMMTIHVAFTNQIRMYRQAILAFLAIATVYTTNTTNNFVWRDSSSSGAAAAGNILLSIINFIWIFYFGTTADEPVHMYLDSFAVYKETPNTQTDFRRRMGEKRRAMAANVRHRNQNDSANAASGRSGTANNLYRMGDISQNVQIGRPTDFSHQTDPTNPNGSNPVADRGSDPLHSTYLYSVDQLHRHGLNGHEVQQELEEASSGTGAARTQRMSLGSIVPGNEDPYFHEFEGYDTNNPIARARAIYNYEAEVSQGEIPFEAGELLDVCDMTGNWWYCKRENGDVGICPKNYLQLLDEHIS